MYINKQRLSIPIEELRELKDALPHGAMVEISDMTDMSVSSVKQVFNGRWDCEKIIDAACQIIAQRSGTIKKRRILIDESLKQTITSTNSN